MITGIYYTLYEKALIKWNEDLRNLIPMSLLVDFLSPVKTTYIFLPNKLKNVSCEYDWWVVETQLCKLRDTSDALIGRAFAMFQL